MIRNHFKTAWRSLVKNKGISLLNIGGLAVGMTAAVLIFLWVQNEIDFDNTQKDANQIFLLTTKTADNKWIWEGSPMLLAPEIKKSIPEIQHVVRLFADNLPIVHIRGELSYEKQCAYVDPEWFQLFSYHFTEGSAVSFAKNPFSIILSVSDARKYFGNRAAVGETIQLDSANYTVCGVVSDAPTNSSFQFKSFIPIAALLTNNQFRQNGENWDNTDYLTFVKLSNTTHPENTAKLISTLIQKNMHDDQNSILAGLVSLKDMHFENNLQASEFEHGNRSVVYIFSVLGFIILLVACINYVNLTTAKASLRAKEVSIRKIIGAGRKELFAQFIIESLLVSLIALACTLVLIYLFLPALNQITGKEFVFSLTSTNLWNVLGSTLLVSLLLNSIYPALILSSFKPLNIFRGITLLNLKDANFRKALVVLQFSISILLITGTLVIYRQLHFIQKANLGYDRTQILTLNLPFNLHLENKPLFMQTIKQELLTQPAVEMVSMANQPVVRISSATTGGDWDGHDTSVNPKLAQLSADADLFKMMRFQMAGGRWFEPGSEADRKNYILNETAVRELNIKQPVIGQRFSLHGVSGQIVGVVKDFHFKSMHEKVGPLVVFNNPEWWNYFMMKTSSSNASAAIQSVERVWKKLAPGVPVEFSFLDERFDELYKQDKLASQLIGVFALIAVGISAVGLFGLAAFASEQKTREVGIRKILGASILSIGKLLSREFIILVTIAFVIAAPLAWWMMSSWLENFAYRIDMSWWMIGLAGAIAILLAMIITNYHAVKVALQNPAKSLKVD